ncbi:unnamed protein product [Menidia menidia]|uniref:(Atlantic silverside) hypothetical protein n=1 Tax=Menidia menidia TaxID=238744 RepID=A0A8S4B7C4_9TELE|nr:unnamed protein product [Menidia menidia]
MPKRQLVIHIAQQPPSETCGQGQRASEDSPQIGTKENKPPWSFGEKCDRKKSEQLHREIRCSSSFTYSSASFSTSSSSPSISSLSQPSPSTGSFFCLLLHFLWLSWALRRAISIWNSRSRASLGSSLTLGWFWMFLAREAGPSVATMTVLAFPPKESCSSLVSFESRYGTCPLRPSANAEITFPRADRERLILAASFRRSPWTPVLVCRSLPARSTRLRRPTRMCFLPSGPGWLHSTVIRNKAWDLDECSFMSVAPTALA